MVEVVNFSLSGWKDGDLEEKLDFVQYEVNFCYALKQLQDKRISDQLYEKFISTVE